MLTSSESIVERQANEDAVAFASTFRIFYKRAKNWKAILWIGTLLLALFQVIAATRISFLDNVFPQDLTPFLVGLSLTVMVVGTLGRAWRIDIFHRTGCLAQQAHDHYVFSSGNGPSFLALKPSLVKKSYREYQVTNSRDIDDLREWWPSSLSKVSLPVGMLICQISTFTWEDGLRKRYQAALYLCLAAVLVSVLLLAFIMAYGIGQMVTYVVLPLIPFLTLLIDEMVGNASASKNASKCLEAVASKWSGILCSANDGDELRIFVGEVQVNWQRYREQSNLVPDWLYWFLREDMEKDMSIDVDALIGEYLSKQDDK